jgi:hypothetical protein
MLANIEEGKSKRENRRGKIEEGLKIEAGAKIEKERK